MDTIKELYGVTGFFGVLVMAGIIIFAKLLWNKRKVVSADRLNREPRSKRQYATESSTQDDALDFYIPTWQQLLNYRAGKIQDSSFKETYTRHLEDSLKNLNQAIATKPHQTDQYRERTQQMKQELEDKIAWLRQVTLRGEPNG